MISLILSILISDNVLVVRVDATQYEGWFYEGAGIYRHVWLNQYDNLHIPDGGFFVYADVQDKNATSTLKQLSKTKIFLRKNVPFILISQIVMENK